MKEAVITPRPWHSSVMVQGVRLVEFGVCKVHVRGLDKRARRSKIPKIPGKKACFYHLDGKASRVYEIPPCRRRPPPREGIWISVSTRVCRSCPARKTPSL